MAVMQIFKIFIFAAMAAALTAQPDAAAKRAAMLKRMAEERAARKEAAAKRRAEREGIREERIDAAKTAKTAAPPARAGQGISGPMHEKYMGKVVFTGVDKDLKSIGEGDLIGEATIGQPIYFRVYLPKTGPQLMQGKLDGYDDMKYAQQLRWSVRYTLAGKPTMETRMVEWGTVNERLDFTTWRGALTKAERSALPGDETFGEFLSRSLNKGWIAAGRNLVVVEVVPHVHVGEHKWAPGDVAARGELTLVYAPGSIRPGSKVCVPFEARQKNPGLEGEILGVARRTWNTTEHKPVQAILTNDGWTLFRHPISGIVVRRTMDAVIVAQGAEYCQYEGYAYSQEHNGSTFAAPGSFTRAVGARKMPCACIAK